MSIVIRECDDANCRILKFEELRKEARVCWGPNLNSVDKMTVNQRVVKLCEWFSRDVIFYRS